MPSPRRHTRLAAAAVALAALATGCTTHAGRPGRPGRPSSPAPSGSIAALKAGATALSLLQAQSSIPPGPGLFTFGLATSKGQLVQGGSPQVWVARDATSRALGPFPATFHRFTESAKHPNDAPKSPLTGFYSAEVDVPSPGNWAVAAVADSGGARGVGTGFLAVQPSDVAAVGSKALSVATPVATTPAGAERICTRAPPDPMHAISLDRALADGKPTVVVFATPLLCESRMCGPVVDEVLGVRDRVGAARANFVHVEIYPERDQSKPAPAFERYGFQSEPWVLVIDRDGVIRARFEGPVVASQVEAALDPLL